MISLGQSLPPLTVISGIVALNQNSAGQTGSQQSGEQRAGGEGQSFRPGQEVVVKVTASKGDGRYTLAVGGERIEVQSRVPLQVGQQLSMLVEEGENGTVLAFKGLDVGQFLTRAMATGGSSQALGMIFGQGLAAQAAGGKAFMQSKGGGGGAGLQSANSAQPSQGLQGSQGFQSSQGVQLQGGGRVAAGGGGAALAGDSAVLQKGMKAGATAGMPAGEPAGTTASLAQRSSGQSGVGRSSGNSVAQTVSAEKATPQQNTPAAAGKTPAGTAADIPKGTARLPVPPAATKMVGLQQQFVEKNAAVSPAASKVPAQNPAQFGRAVEQFTTELGRQITPLLDQGKVAEAMDKVASALRSLAPFFPPRSGGAIPKGLTQPQQQLLEAFSALQQPSSAGEIGMKGAKGSDQVKEAALGRVIQHLQGQLTPAPAASGQKMAAPPQNPQAMLATLNASLQGLQEMVQLPASFQQQPADAPVFRSGLDGLFAFHLRLGAAKTATSSAGISPQSTTAPAAAFSPAASFAGGWEGSSGAILQQLVDALGLDMEKLLAKGDVRGAAQGLKFQLLRQVKEGGEQIEREMQIAKGSSGSSKSVEESGLLRQAGESHQALQSLNFLQLLQANLDKQGMLALPLPLPFLEQGFLLMEKQEEGQGKDGENSEGTRFSMLMKLSSLGNVRIDLLQTKESVYARFHTESAEITELFRKSQQELRQGLAPLQLQGLSYSSDPPSDPVAVLLQKCEGGGGASLFRASV